MEGGGQKNRKRGTSHTRRWRFACGSRFHATRLWHCDFTVMREHARANGSISFPATYLSFSLHSLAHSDSNFFANLRRAISIFLYFISLFLFLYYFTVVLLYSPESEFVSSFNSSFPEHSFIRFFFFLYLLAYTFVYFVLSTVFFLGPFLPF